MDYVLGLMFVITLYLAFLLTKASKKIKKLELDVDQSNSRMSRFHDIRQFDKELGFFTHNFFDYVIEGKKRLADVKRSILLGYDLEKKNTIHSFMKKEQEVRQQDNRYNDNRPTI